MSALITQGNIIIEIINKENARKIKINKPFSIERLEGLLEPIRDRLNYITMNCHGGIHCPYRQQLEEKNIREYNEYMRNNCCQAIPLKPEILRNEELFTTVLSIFKKQDARIKELEKLCNHLNDT